MAPPVVKLNVTAEGDGLSTGDAVTVSVIGTVTGELETPGEVTLSDAE